MASKTKQIAGLPDYPVKKLALDKKPTKKGKCIRSIKGTPLKVVFENGHLVQTHNTKGKLPAVWIVETSYPGFTVRLYNKPYTILGYGYRQAERLAVRLALKGHRTVLNY